MRIDVEKILEDYVRFPDTSTRRSSTITDSLLTIAFRLITVKPLEKTALHFIDLLVNWQADRIKVKYATSESNIVLTSNLLLCLYLHKPS